MKKAKKSVARSQAKSRSVRSVSSGRYNPHKSPIVQGGIVFLMIAAIILVAFVFKNFTP